eukprot:1439498-Ditylum_brightwellii.AAC.1
MTNCQLTSKQKYAVLRQGVMVILDVDTIGHILLEDVQSTFKDQVEAKTELSGLEPPEPPKIADSSFHKWKKGGIFNSAHKEQLTWSLPGICGKE